MLSNKKITFIISFLVAFALWAYVIGTKDPITNKQLSDVPVTFDKISDLQDEGLAVSSVDVENINVIVSGNKSKLPDIDAKDVLATIDASQLVKGSNDCKIVVKLPEDYTCVDQSVAKAKVEVSEAVSEDRDVKVSFSGSADSDKEATVQDIADKKVTVTGAEGLINRTAYVQGIINVENLGTKSGAYNVSLKAVDSDGNEVKYVTLSPEKTKVSAILYSTKKVDLEVPVTKGKTIGIEKTVETPKSVTVKGPDEALAKITKLKAETLNVSNITQNTTLDVKINLPEGIMIADSVGKIQAKISVVNNLKSKTLDFSSKDIKIKGAEEAKVANFSGKITIKGDAEAVDKVTTKSLGLSINLTDAEEGEHTVQVEYTTPSGISSITINPESVNVTI